MHFGRNEVEPFHQSITGHRAGGRCKTRGGFLVRQILPDDADFGEHRAVVQLQRRHVTLGIDRPEIRTRCGFFVRDVDFFEFEGMPGFQQHDMRRQRTGAGRVIQFHRISSGLG